MIPIVGAREEAPRVQEAERVRRVLLVDEALPVRNAMRDILVKLGIRADEITQATNAEEALAAFRPEDAPLVFCELVGDAPEDGLDLIHAMLHRCPQAKIVLVTAEPRESAEVRAAIRSGVFGLVEKPLRQDKIRAVLQDLDSEEGGIERMR